MEILPADEELFPTKYGMNPPKEWMTEILPEVGPEIPKIISSEGRVCALVATWEDIYLNSDGTFRVTPSPTNNRGFHEIETVCANGELLDSGTVSYGGGHIAAPLHIQMKMRGDPSRAKLQVRAVENEIGTYICGFVRPKTTRREVAEMRAATLSGVWAEINGQWDYYGPDFVDRGAHRSRTHTNASEEEIQLMRDRAAAKYMTLHDEESGLVLASAPEVINQYKINTIREDSLTMGQEETILKAISKVEKLVQANIDQPEEPAVEETDETESDDSRLTDAETRISALEEEILAIKSSIDLLDT